ncbi:MAG TPA: HlyD family type I secretion periplasmic adaptor subunit [bacterium]|nr:HlyD family type I secretion periplasmic adaptor subunit [bacterium]
MIQQRARASAGHPPTPAPLRPPKGRELEFLPAALEIQESPPSPTGRIMAATICALLFAGALWATFGSIDIVVTARGKTIPRGFSKIVQPLDAGIIRAIRVRDGQAVKQGAVLIELDPTTSTAEYQRALNEYRSAQIEVARLRALISGAATLTPPAGGDPDLVRVQQQMLRDQSAEQQSRLAAARMTIAQREAAIQQTQAEIARLEAAVRTAEETAGLYDTLVAQGASARLEYLDAQQRVVDASQNLAAARHKLVEGTAALREAQHQYQATGSEFVKARLGELAEQETRAASLAQEVAKASQQTAIQRLTAPIDGVVQQLAVHTVGGVVTPAQQLLVIVPNARPLEVDAAIENQDIGFVKAGQRVQVKVDTFPYTRYGTIGGVITTVSRDAVPADKDTKLLYTARIALDRSTVRVGDQDVALAPGMTVTVDAMTGKRRLIEFFLSPLLRYQKESLRER